MKKELYTFFFVMAMILTCTVDASIDTERFENHWWEIQEYPICFNFHETGSLLVYEEFIVNEGPWEFTEPNQYSVFDETIEVYSVDECWKLKGYKNLNLSACECEIFTAN